MTDELHCWRCGAVLRALSLPLSRLDECPDCSMHLHVCRMCTHFDPGVARQCREDDAEEVRDKERANFCDYFVPSAVAFDSSVAAAETRARQQLESLFGDTTDTDGAASDSAAQAAEDLFKKPR